VGVRCDSLNLFVLAVEIDVPQLDGRSVDGPIDAIPFNGICALIYYIEGNFAAVLIYQGTRVVEWVRWDRLEIQREREREKDLHSV